MSMSIPLWGKRIYQPQPVHSNVLLFTTNFLNTAVLGCAVGYVARKCCDCVVHGKEVWTGVQMCKSHSKGLTLKE